MNIQDRTLGELARRIPGATRIFRAYKLDFCCNGDRSLRLASSIHGLDPSSIAEQLRNLSATSMPDRDWDEVSDAQLISHILLRYHAKHREQLPELILLARKVEEVHRSRSECPVGLARLLQDMDRELARHMRMEEDVLFPMLLRRAFPAAAKPIAMMRREHEDLGDRLRGMAMLTGDFVPPAGACSTWRALYRGVETFHRDLMEHVHLENNVLFERAAAPDSQTEH